LRWSLSASVATLHLFLRTIYAIDKCRRTYSSAPLKAEVGGSQKLLLGNCSGGRTCPGGNISTGEKCPRPRTGPDLPTILNFSSFHIFSTAFPAKATQVQWDARNTAIETEMGVACVGFSLARVCGFRPWYLWCHLVSCVAYTCFLLIYAFTIVIQTCLPATCWSTYSCWHVLTLAPQTASVHFVPSQFQ